MRSLLRLARFHGVAFGFGSLLLQGAPQVSPYGSGINPAGSLELTFGSPQIGTSFQLTLRNTSLANPPFAVAYLAFANQPAIGFPAGLSVAGLGMAAPGAIGELLLDLAAPNPFLILGPELYLGGSSPGTSFSVSVPENLAVVGLDLFAQGLLVTPAYGYSLGLTNGLQFELGPAPQFPGMVAIQPGSFQLGSNASSGPPYFGPIGPVQQVTITKPFWMGRFEVSQSRFQAVMGWNPSTFVGENLPVERVSWIDAQAYCAALTAQQAALGNLPAGYQFRLPTEAEWEYACRAGTTTEFNVGAALLCDQAKFSYSYHSSSGCSSHGTVAVDSFAPNAWGLHNMHGNVAEWCLDSYGFYTASPKTDPFVTGGTSRIFRGASWNFASTACRSASRDYNGPGYKASSIGFRIVLAPILLP